MCFENQSHVTTMHLLMTHLGQLKSCITPGHISVQGEIMHVHPMLRGILNLLTIIDYFTFNQVIPSGHQEWKN